MQTVTGSCCRTVRGADGLTCVSRYTAGWLPPVVAHPHSPVANDAASDVRYRFDGVIVTGVRKDDCGLNADDATSAALERMRGRKSRSSLVPATIGRIADEKRALAPPARVTRFRRSNEAAFSGKPRHANLRQNLRRAIFSISNRLSLYFYNNQAESPKNCFLVDVVRLCPSSADIATGHSDHLSVMVDRSLKIACESASQFYRILGLAFPDRENPPSEASQLPSLPSISDTIPLQLWKPEVKTCRWRLPPRAAMPMPKTPMD